MLLGIVVLCTLTACGSDKQPAATDPPENHTVSFYYNYEGAEEPYTTQTVEHKRAAVIPDAPAREDYEFDNWYEDSEGKIPVDFENAVSADATYYAGWIKTAANVTLDPNYPDAQVSSVKVSLGEVLTQPADPTRDGFRFTAWYTDKDATSAYDLSAAVNDDITLYAGWEEVSAEAASDNVLVKFLYNYEGAPSEVYYEKEIVAGRRVAKPANPEREGYYFGGWFTDEAFTKAFSFNTNISSSLNLYPKWMKINTFEAEYTDVSGIIGHGYSGEVEGVNIIEIDRNGLGASNGYFVSYLYGNQIEMVFEIESEADFDDVVLALSLGGEQISYSFTDEEYLVQVNGENLSYGSISFDLGEGRETPFTTHIIAENVALKQGHNTIKLITNNERLMVGTMYATAPRVDCLYLYANVGLTWAEGYPLESNLDTRW